MPGCQLRSLDGQGDCCPLSGLFAGGDMFTWKWGKTPFTPYEPQAPLENDIHDPQKGTLRFDQPYINRFARHAGDILQAWQESTISLSHVNPFNDSLQQKCSENANIGSHLDKQHFKDQVLLVWMKIIFIPTVLFFPW